MKKENEQRILEYVVTNLDKVIYSADWTALKLFKGELNTFLKVINSMHSYQWDDIIDIFCGKEPEEDAEQG